MNCPIEEKPKMTRYLLENTKAGAYIWYASEAQAKRASAAMGWCDYSITSQKTV